MKSLLQGAETQTGSENRKREFFEREEVGHVSLRIGRRQGRSALYGLNKISREHKLL